MLLVAVAAPAAAEVLEEVVAVVGTTPILASDITLAELVELEPPSPGETEAAYRSRLLTARIRLELQTQDLEASGTLYRLPIELDRAVAALRARAPAAADLDRQLAAAGLDGADLEDLALRLAAVEAYTEHNLRARVTITMDELEAAYREVVAAPITAAGGTPPPLTEVRDRVSRIVVERKLNDEIERWLADARERFDVTRYAP